MVLVQLSMLTISMMNTQHLQSPHHPERIFIYDDVQRVVSKGASVGLNWTAMIRYVTDAPHI